MNDERKEFEMIKGLRAKTNMTMSYELITPEIAKKMLETAETNRYLSKGVSQAYANDMSQRNWCEKSSSAISFDEDGVLRDGQHRLTAVINSGENIKTWVCRGVSSDAIFDSGRKRSTADQIMIQCPELEKVYKTTRYQGVVRPLISGWNRRYVTSSEIIDFTKEHKDILDGFFLRIPQSTVAKISTVTVHLALFTAYCAGESMDGILEFYEILCSGMGTKEEHHPIICYRNYLKDSQVIASTTSEVIKCQYALKRFLSGSKAKSLRYPDKLVYPFPFKDEEDFLS